MKWRDLWQDKKSNTWLLPTLIFLMALLYRLVFFYQISDTPLFRFMLPGQDQTTFNEWATSISKGAWLGSGAFRQEPFYPYLIGFLYLISKGNYTFAILIQHLLGALAALLTFLCARAVFSTREAILAGLLATGFWTLPIYENVLLRESIALFFHVWLFYILLSTGRKPKKKSLWFFSGLLFGLNVITRANTILYFPFIIIWIGFWFSDLEKKTRFRNSLIFTLGLFIALLPIMLRNLVVGVKPWAFSQQGSMVFYVGNAPDADGVGYSLLPSLEGKTDQERISSVIDYNLKHPGHFMKLFLNKTRMFFNGYEVPNNINCYLFKRFSSLLKYTAFHFGVIAALAFSGFLFFNLRDRKEVLLLFMIIGITFSVVIFYILSRFRLPILPFMMIAAGRGIIGLYDCLKMHNFKKFTLGIFIFIIVLILALPKTGSFGYIRPNDYTLLGQAYENSGKYDEAVKEYQNALEVWNGYQPARQKLIEIQRRHGWSLLNSQKN